MKFRMIWMGSDDDPEGSPPSPKKGAAGALTPPSGKPRYELCGNEMIRWDGRKEGRSKTIAVANFGARIVRDIVVDNGREEQRLLGLEAELGGHTLAFQISAAEFTPMHWVLKYLGPEAIIYPGQQQHARAAVQYLSGRIPQERIFSHLGWREIEGHWAYLHAGGAVSAGALNCPVHVQVPAAVRNYQLRLPQSPDELVMAVRRSLGFLSVAPDRVSFPLLAAVYRAAFGDVDFSLFVAGRTGVFKTALAALCQQHFGEGMDAGRLPANFSSTANALEAVTFCAKDALVVVDDFVPTGRPGDQGLQGLAERLFRAAGNHQGRSRLGADGRPREPEPPRALVLATGEDVPPGASIRSRLVIVEVGPGEVDPAQLSECQRAARQGHLAMSMAGFLRWAARDYPQWKQRQATRALKLRDQRRGQNVHARLPSALAELESAWEIFLEFALESGAVSDPERNELAERARHALDEIALIQTPYQEAADPALQFVELLRTALAGGQAYVVDRSGKAPAEAESWGWQSKSRGWVSRGLRIGWVKGPDLFLDPVASYQVAQALAGPDRLPVSAQTLHHRLRERGLLAAVDPGRHMVQVRRTLEGVPRQVLHLRASDFTGPARKSARGSASSLRRDSSTRATG